MKNLNEEESVISVIAYKEKKLKKKAQKVLLICVGILLLLMVLFGVGRIVETWKYESYDIIGEIRREEVTSVKYIQMGENIFKYGGDDLTLINRQGEKLWDEPYLINNPEVTINKDTGVIYDKKGSDIIAFDVNGIQGEIKTKMPVVKARVSPQKVIAAILEDGENTWLNLYDFSGNELATIKTRVDSPGYPIDMALSEDGQSMAVTYFCIKAFKPSSYVAFYNFGNIGQNQMDNKVNAYTYTDSLVPIVKTMSDSYVLAFTDDGFILYHGEEIPEEKVRITIEGEIETAFSNDKYIGMIVYDDQTNQYELQLYDREGQKKCSAKVNIPFEKAYIIGNEIIVYGKDQFAIYTMRGQCRYEGPFRDGNIENIFKMAKNRYMIVTDQGYENVKLK